MQRAGVAGLVLLATGGTAVVVVADNAASSPVAFRGYVREHLDGWAAGDMPGRPQRDHAWAMTHPGQVEAEGRRACDWLDEQPDAPDLDPSGRSAVHSAVVRFLRVPGGDPLPLARMSRMYLVYGAFGYLCPGTRRDKTSPQSDADD